MRLFIAIGLPAEVKAELAKAQAATRSEAAQFTSVKLENLHLTLKFLGEVDERKAVKVREALRTISFSPFAAALSGIGVFPSENYIRVVWVGLESEDGIMKLQRDIDATLQPLDFRPERDFTPHLTICRVRSVKDKEAFVKSVKDITIDRKEFTVSSFQLMKSTLTKEGPVYEVVEEVKAARQ